MSASVAEGQSQTVGDETVATIQSVESEPATVVLESEDGELHEREHPQNMDVTLIVELRTSETATGVSFQGQQLSLGSSIVLTFDTMTVEGEVRSLERTRTRWRVEFSSTNCTTFALQSVPIKSDTLRTSKSHSDAVTSEITLVK